MRSPSSRPSCRPGSRLATAGFTARKGCTPPFARARFRPWGRRGGSGTYIWKRDDLDEFLRGEAELGGPMEVRDEREGAPARDLGAEGRRVLPANAPTGPTVRKVRGVPARASRHDAEPGRAREVSPSLRRAGPRERAQASADALEHVRRVALRVEGE